MGVDWSRVDELGPGGGDSWFVVDAQCLGSRQLVSVVLLLDLAASKVVGDKKKKATWMI